MKIIAPKEYFEEHGQQMQHSQLPYEVVYYNPDRWEVQVKDDNIVVTPIVTGITAPHWVALIIYVISIFLVIAFVTIITNSR